MLLLKSCNLESTQLKIFPCDFVKISISSAFSITKTRTQESKTEMKGLIYIQWNPDFTRKLGVKLQCLTEERERFLVRVIERFEKMRVRVGIPLYTRQNTPHTNAQTNKDNDESIFYC